MSETQTTQEKFSVILEDEPKWVPVPGHTNRQRLPVTRQLAFIEAKDLDDAWLQARTKWLLQKSGLQIVDIIPGELTEPLRPSEHVPQKAPQEVIEPQEQPEVHDG
jgi:hypothetical protein